MVFDDFGFSERGNSGVKRAIKQRPSDEQLKEKYGNLRRSKRTSKVINILRH